MTAQKTTRLGSLPETPATIRSVLASFAAATALMLTACGGGQPATPDNYGEPNPDGDGYYGNFMYGCTGVLPTDGAYVDVTLGSEAFCRCVYDGMVETVPFDEAKRFDDAQAESAPGDITIPANIAAVQEGCGDT
jgi:hypothetical protein